MDALSKKFNIFEQDMVILRSLAISLAGKDKEGSYNSSFIKRILSNSRINPSFEFKNKKDFLKLVS